MGKVLGFRSWWLAAVVLLGAAASAAAEPSSSPEPFPVVDGTVSSIATDGTTACVGGDFTEIGAPSGPLVMLSAADGTVQRTFRGIAAHPSLDSPTPVSE
jgi:hypothetical protein